MDRDDALDRVETVLGAVESDPMPVPVREVWVYGDVALGLDPLDRLDIYLTKDILMRNESDRAERFETEYGVKGVGTVVDADWAERYPEHLRANDSGHAAPEQCLAAHLLPDDDPVHLEVCNASFSDNVTQRLKGAMARDAPEEILDPRGVCLWVDGRRDEEALSKLRAGDFALPTLSGALEMLGLEEDAAADAARAMREHRADREGRTVRGDVV
jgi:hypothetical protein